MAIASPRFHLSTRDSAHPGDWRILLALARRLDEANLPFKVDGKTMLFAHGIDFPLERICLSFPWREERRALDFFGHPGPARSPFPGFKYFDAEVRGMAVRCMFYGADDAPEDAADEAFLRHTDAVRVGDRTLRVQSVAFYLANADPNEPLYPRAERWMREQDAKPQP